MLLFVLLYMIVIGSITSAKPSSLAVDSLNPSGAADDSGIDLFGSASVFIPETADQDLSIGPGEGGTDTATDGFLDKTAIDPPDLYMTSDMMLEDQTGLETTFQDPAEDLSSLQNGCNADVTNVAARRRRDSTWPVGIEDANDICVPDTAAQTRTQKEECPEGYTPFCCFGGVTWMHGQWLVKLCNEFCVMSHRLIIGQLGNLGVYMQFLENKSASSMRACNGVAVYCHLMAWEWVVYFGPYPNDT